MALLLLVGLSACSNVPDANTVHWTKAEFAFQSSGSFEPPATPPSSLDADGAWKIVDLPHARERHVSLPDASGADPAEIAWYRFTLPDEVRRDVGGDIHLYLPRWQTVGALAVYADGKLIWRTHGSLVWNSFNRPVWLALTEARDAMPPHTILIRMASQRGIGGALSTAWAGPAETLGWRNRLRNWIQADWIIWGSAAFAIIGLFSFAVWCVRRRETTYLIFFATSSAFVLRTMHVGIGDQPPAIPDAWFGWITVNSLGWTLVGMFFLILRFNNHRMPRFEKGLIAGSIVSAVATLPGLAPPAFATSLAPVIYGTIMVLISVFSAIGLWLAWRNRLASSMVVAAWFALNLPLALHDSMMVSYRANIEGIYYSAYSFVGLLTIWMVLIFRRYTDSIAAVEAANVKLEQSLAEQARELNASNRRLREFEQQQALMQERQRMMREMHDGMGSSLITALRMVEHGELNADTMAQMLKECIDDLKLSIDSLTITNPDLPALLSTLRFRLEPRLNAAGIKLDWDIGDVPALPWLDAQSALHILRILQEVLANIIKHTRATRIAFATRVDDNHVEVVLDDNGGGSFRFAPFDGDAPSHPAATPGKRGLTNIINRARAIGARCVWTASDTGGIFVLSLPRGSEKVNKVTAEHDSDLAAQ